ncbi:hypothetical protein, partial [Planomonospora alba]|uniref:hypothetical protein n=1 Tax=Planomonospora alba TaxID=161354 RepID=UPI0031ED6611
RQQMMLASGPPRNPDRFRLPGRIDAREAGEAERTRTRIEELTARARELDEAIDHLRITRTTLRALAGEDDAEPAARSPALPLIPGHPAYQQISAVFADTGRPLRARDLCEALDPPIVSEHAENIRSTLKRLVGRGVLVETEPGSSAQPRP